MLTVWIRAVFLSLHYGRYWWRHGWSQSNSRLGTAKFPHFGVGGGRQVSEGSPGHMSAVRKEGEIDICKYSIISTKG
ncbi:hypothetical protein AFERRI_50007 [Acidithiobacillus ferrivorans]|uniref:Uncharacterized protein n=1 Tax=Acidithiobacillus ferrivorans TaxID=160808 RepID=A0A060UR17_9PROT|nr:hypothetical protein AFERRI_50007 [Acidithiobacillus ferrivorans]